MEAYEDDYLLAFKKYLYRPSSPSPTFREEGPETKVNDLVNEMHLGA